MVRLAVALAISLTTTTTTALAAPQPLTADEEQDVDSYRGWVIASDLASLAVMLSPLALENHLPETAQIAVMQVGAAGLFFGSSVVHFAHGETKRGFASMGLRYGLTGLGAAFGMMSGCQGNDLDACVTNSTIGAGVGLVTAIVIDMAYMTDRPTERRAAAGWAPTVSASPGGGSVGLAGTF